MGCKYPPVVTIIAIENGHRHSGFTHWKWWFSIVMLVYQRVFDIPKNKGKMQWRKTTSHFYVSEVTLRLIWLGSHFQNPVKWESPLNYQGFNPTWSVMQANYANHPLDYSIPNFIIQNFQNWWTNHRKFLLWIHINRWKTGEKQRQTCLHLVLSQEEALGPVNKLQWSTWVVGTIGLYIYIYLYYIIYHLVI